jgi:hypothetical protein
VSGRAAPLVAGLLGALAFAACSKSEDMPAEGGGGGGAAGAGTTCQQIRICILDGQCADETCVQNCAQRGTTTAQAAFETLRACTAKACPAISDVNCACGEQCQAGGSCLHEADVCLGTATVDDVCDSFCA